MNRINKIFLGVVCFLIISVSWIVVLGSKSNNDKQMELLKEASEYISDGIYILAVPLLEEAAGYEDEHTLKAETKLKEVYLKLIDKGYRREYIGILEKQMNKEDPAVESFSEAANFYLENSKINDMLSVLRDGIEKTGSDELIDLYEKNRYVYKIGRYAYEDVTDILEKTISVKRDGLWGVANSSGELVIPCEYEKISSYSKGRVIVKKNREVFAVDGGNNRVALLKENILDFGNYSNERVTLLMDDGWRRATGDFMLGSEVFEEIGTYSNGYVAAKQNGSWGVVDLSVKWIIPPEYDELIMDDMGRSYAQNGAFVKKNNLVNLIVDGEIVGETYEDAKPFNDEGYAAVKRNGQWGFIDILGELKIDYQFEDALSFGQDVAAVKQGEYWGYINLDGKIVIEPVFIKAKSFSDGNAPVLTDRGWQFITLIEHEKGGSL